MRENCIRTLHGGTSRSSEYGDSLYCNKAGDNKAKAARNARFAPFDGMDAWVWQKERFEYISVTNNQIRELPSNTVFHSKVVPTPTMSSSCGMINWGVHVEKK
jgi:hypothetical protein